MQKTEWFNRKFPAMEDNGLLPQITERLSGTPARLEEMIALIPSGKLTIKPAGKWSIKEELGHLSDLEPLWLGRVDDLIAHRPELSAADLTNQKTHQAGHNSTEVHVLLQRFRELRMDLVKKLRDLDESQLLYSSLHSRLKTPMRAIDLAYFVAEHDDHHLACIRTLM